MARVAWVETHVGTAKEARALGDAIVFARLAACVNTAPIRSAYWWKGRVERSPEVKVTFTTTARARPALVRALRARHPYEVPYIAWADHLEVTAAYAEWVTEQVRRVRAPSRRRQRLRPRRTR